MKYEEPSLVSLDASSVKGADDCSPSGGNAKDLCGSSGTTAGGDCYTSGGVAQGYCQTTGRSKGK
ncbi:MAG: hypothetical protein GY851_04540 [bacterium]|nr:hypothetical protein [bacterium]